MWAVNFHSTGRIYQKEGQSMHNAIKDVFDRLVAEPQHESGHSYIGKIGMKYNFVIRREFPDTTGLEEVYEFINEDQDHNDKWGPAYCVVHKRLAHFYGYTSC